MLDMTRTSKSVRFRNRFADLGRRPHHLLAALKAVGLFLPAISLTKGPLREILQDAGFVIVNHWAFGSRPQIPYFVLRKPV
ncbi:MAG: hypothetical protein P8O10_13825 [Pseudorhodobacter sp.]|nr:hypothetical protein [Pseudorhodobacter sp.]